jgi:hypothetical protein
MSQSVEEAVRGLRVVVVGLIACLLIFAAGMWFAAGSVSEPHEEFLTYGMFVLVLFGLGAGLVYLIQYRRMLAEIRACAAEIRLASGPTEMVLSSYRRFIVVGGGLIEGPAFFALILQLMTRSIVPLAAAVGAVLLLAAHMPSQDRLRRLIEKGTRL